jgi:hypothetical protein
LLLYRDAAKRIPANVLLQSPWLDTHNLTNVSNAVATMQQALSTMKENENKEIPRATIEF